ncbi:MAG: hypothetical protein R3330_18680, partial [Saprospiraceae bacterium]|nr:hypothetical protein [Saprospiraceae bacterium]
MDQQFSITRHLTMPDNIFLQDYQHPHGPYFPSAAIVVDPFHQDIAGTGYQQWAAFYSDISGSAWMRIQNCVIQNFPVGIAISPHGELANAENITIEKVKIKNTLSAIVICQSQARSVTVRDCSISRTRIVFDSDTYGGGRGSLPEVTGCNISKDIGWLFKAKSGYAAGHFYQVYAENIFGLGYATQNKHVYSFSQCYFKFPARERSQGLHNPSVLECGSASFDGCTILRGSKKEAIEPVNMHVEQLAIRNSNIDAVVVNNGLTYDAETGRFSRSGVTITSGALSQPGFNVLDPIPIPNGEPVRAGMPVLSKQTSMLSGNDVLTCVGFIDKVNQPQGAFILLE